MTCTAVRAFLRFLGATGRLPIGMEAALPPVAAWSNSTIPRYLPSADLEHLLASSRGGEVGLRDRAALLLLARLGLRAGDVVRLRLIDIDFRGGTLAIGGKGRRNELLPLPQDVGDALITYLSEARPRTAVAKVFLTCPPPRRAMTEPG
jgi:integrase/recombinase XerD